MSSRSRPPKKRKSSKPGFRGKSHPPSSASVIRSPGTGKPIGSAGFSRSPHENSVRRDSSPIRPANPPRKDHRTFKPSREERTGEIHLKKDKKPNRDRDRGKRRNDGREFSSKFKGRKDSRGKPSRRREGQSYTPRGSNQSLKLRATIDKNRKGFGFVIFDRRGLEDAFLNPGIAARFFHGDRVEVTVQGREIREIRLIEHGYRELIGKFSPLPGMGPRTDREVLGWISYERKNASFQAVVLRSEAQGVTLAPQDWVRVKIRYHQQGPHPITAEVIENYGQELPARADVTWIAAEFGLVEAHSAAARDQARAYAMDLSPEGLAHRTDFRQLPFLTIDGETARDFDDAVHVERSQGGGWILWVAIADVSHYVKDQTPLDEEAFARGTSVYFPERAFHMLPSELSENLCSLKPNEPRFTLVARMEYDASGKKRDVQLFEGLIESRRRATYNEIEKEREKFEGDRSWEFAPHHELYRKIRASRSARGSIDFELPESEIRVDPQGEVISISRRPRLDAHRLIEEFMIAANESVTEWMLARDWPFLYRIHEEPSMEALLNFQKLAATAGFTVDIRSPVHPLTLAQVVRDLEGHAAQDLLNSALLRSMKQARYSAEFAQHYGLASEGYTHFTSPIRRYPDLVVHRLLRAAIRAEKAGRGAPQSQERDKLQKELEEISDHCSYRERLASDAERDAIKLKQVRAVLKRVGDEFEGKVTGLMDSGFFVQIVSEGDPFVEGMVPKDSFDDDLYEFLEERMAFVGKRRKRAFRVGDLIRVQLARADLERRQIDFKWVEEELGAEARDARSKSPQFARKENF